MKLLLAILSVVTISFSALADGRPATAEDIKKMSSKLSEGTYSGLTPNGNPCTVTVSDNGGSGAGYSISVTPVTYSSANLIVASASITVGTQIQPRTQITAYGVLGINFESYFRIDNDNGKKTITIISRVNDDRSNAICTIL